MILIIEGPDGSGKTWLANKLREDHPEFSYVSMLGGRTEPIEISRRRTYNVIYSEAHENFLTERFHAISDSVYRSFDNKQSIFSNIERGAIYRTLGKNGARIIYCRPSLSTLLSMKLESKGDDDPEWIKLLSKNILNIVRSYDFLMNDLTGYNIPILRYDRTDPWALELMENFI